MKGTLPPSWSTGALPMPFLAFLLGEAGLQRWTSPWPGPLGHWDAHPSLTRAGCPFSAWPARCRPWELRSFPPCRPSFPEAPGGVILLEVLYSQTLPSRGFTPPVGSRLPCPCPSITPSPLAQGCSHPRPTLGSRACFHLRDPLASEEGALGFSGCFLFSCVTPSLPLPRGWGGAGRGCSVFLCFPENWFAHLCVWGWTVP